VRRFLLAALLIVPGSAYAAAALASHPTCDKEGPTRGAWLAEPARPSREAVRPPIFRPGTLPRLPRRPVLCPRTSRR